MNLAYKKILGKFTKVLGFGKTPPPCWEKFPNNIVFFFESVPKQKGKKNKKAERQKEICLDDLSI